MSRVSTQSCALPNGEEIFYRAFGEGSKTVLLLHGNMASSRFFEPFFPYIKDCRIVAPDLRGFGNSSYNRRFSSLLTLAEDMSDFCDKLQLSSVCAAGWSMGGGVALELAAIRPDLVRCVALINGISCRGFPVPPKDERGHPIPNSFYENREQLENDTRQVGLVRNAIADCDEKVLRRIWDRGIYINSRPSDSEYAAYIAEMCKQRCNDDAYWSLASFNMTNEFTGIVDGNDHISRIRVPVLAFHSDRDYICEPWQAQDNLRYLGNRMELIMLENCGHSSFTDYPNEIGQKISDFAAKHLFVL